MKLIIAHVRSEAFEPVRTELLDLGVPRTTISEVHSSSPRAPRRLRYRGAAMDSHLRAELRLECLATDEQAPAVVDVLRRHASRDRAFAGPVAVLDLEQPHDADDVHAGDPRERTAV